MVYLERLLVATQRFHALKVSHTFPFLAGNFFSDCLVCKLDFVLDWLFSSARDIVSIPARNFKVQAGRYRFSNYFPAIPVNLNRLVELLTDFSLLRCLVPSQNSKNFAGFLPLKGYLGIYSKPEEVLPISSAATQSESGLSVF